MALRWGHRAALAESGSVEGAIAPWCAPELSTVGAQTCFYRPPNVNSGTLVIFLHGLTSAAPEAAWPLQRRLAANAKAYGFSAMVPKGRAGAGPGRDPNVLAWPTALELQPQLEPEIFAEWHEAIASAERQHGRFQRVLLFGFSNGAYYASNLAFRSAFEVDGVAAFAGGSGSKYQRLLANRSKRQTPLFVGYGRNDPDHSRQEQMVEMLDEIRWPHRVLAAKVGHSVTDAQIRAALRYLGHPMR